jgi:hydroxymethylbilane synthase
MSAPTPLRIGTRGSALARTQTEQVASRLREAGVAVTVEVISTLGDRRHDLPVARLGGDGVFVRELEQALLDGRIDAAVHSLKDLPTAETPGLLLAAILVFEIDIRLVSDWRLRAAASPSRYASGVTRSDSVCRPIGPGP